MEVVDYRVHRLATVATGCSHFLKAYPVIQCRVAGPRISYNDGKPPSPRITLRGTQRMRSTLSLCLAIAFSLIQVAHLSAAGLRILWIDTEGGAATLIVTPAGESILIDTGIQAFAIRIAS